MNALTLLKHDHANVEALFERYEHTGPRAFAEKTKIADKIIEQLSVHAAIEEQLLYPAVRAAIPDATSDVLEGLEEHHVVKWTLSELEKTPATDERFHAKMTVLIEMVRHHAKEEEEDMFPQIREAMTNQQLEELGTALETAKQTAPTRPHPRQPDTPPLNLLLGIPAAFIDKAMKTGKETVDRVMKDIRNAS